MTILPYEGEPKMSARKIAAAMICSLCAMPPAAATPHVKKSVSLDMATRMVEAARAEAAKQGLTVSIVVLDEVGNVVTLARMDGAGPWQVEIATKKARTALLFRQPSKFAQQRLNEGDWPILSVDGMLPLQGAVPILDGEKAIGAIAASGAASEQDEALARLGVETVMGKK